jgi:hypothetical protein
VAAGSRHYRQDGVRKLRSVRLKPGFTGVSA